MTYFHYYATTSQRLDRVLQYGVFPLAKAAGLIAGRFVFGIKDNNTLAVGASDFARVVSFMTYASLTSTFFGLESKMIDTNAREAVAAEMGIDPDKVAFSDFGKSKNTVISGAYKDILRLQKYRFGADALFLLPIAMRHTSAALDIPYFTHSKDVFSEKQEHQSKWTPTALMLSGHNAWDFSPLVGKAAYWAGETYFVDKSSHYEVVKLRENLESTGKDMSTNDLLGVYQRTRKDNKLSMIETKEEYEAIRPLLTRMKDAYNKHDGKFGLSEITYLIGLGKINIHAQDGKNLSHVAMVKSSAEIDKVTSIGLEGVREENKKLREQDKGAATPERAKSFVDRVADSAFSVAQIVMGGRKSRRPEEYISPRSPDELTSFSNNISR